MLWGGVLVCCSLWVMSRIVSWAVSRCRSPGYKTSQWRSRVIYMHQDKNRSEVCIPVQVCVPQSHKAGNVRMGMDERPPPYAPAAGQDVTDAAHTQPLGSSCGQHVLPV